MSTILPRAQRLVHTRYGSLVIEAIEIHTDSAHIEAFVAGPDGDARGGVLVFCDVFGLRPRIAEMIQEIASWGYVVLAPNLFHRDGDAADLAPTVDLTDPRAKAQYWVGARLNERIAGLTPDLFAQDLPAYLATLQQFVRDAGPIGAVGYCLGARLAVRAGGQFPDKLVAVAGFHGGHLVTDAPDSPHTLIQPSVSYLFGHADNDASMTETDAAALDAELQVAGSPFQSAIYPGAPHGFTMADSSSWHEPSYERHLVELKDLLSQTIG